LSRPESRKEIEIDLDGNIKYMNKLDFDKLPNQRVRARFTINDNQKVENYESMRRSKASMVSSELNESIYILFVNFLFFFSLYRTLVKYFFLFWSDYIGHFTYYSYQANECSPPIFFFILHFNINSHFCFVIYTHSEFIKYSFLSTNDNVSPIQSESKYIIIV
jgi:hypothetical protein